MFRNNHSLLTIVFGLLFMPSLVMILYFVFFEPDRQIPVFLIHIFTAPLICFITGSLYCSLTKRDNLLLFNSKEEISLAFEILEKNYLEMPSVLGLQKLIVKKMETMSSLDKKWAYILLASDEKLLELIETGKRIEKERLTNPSWQ